MAPTLIWPGTVFESIAFPFRPHPLLWEGNFKSRAALVACFQSRGYLSPLMINVDNVIVNLLLGISEEMIVLRQSTSCRRNLSHKHLNARTHFRSIQTVKLIKQTEQEKLSGKGQFILSALLYTVPYNALLYYIKYVFCFIYSFIDIWSIRIHSNLPGIRM